MLALAKAASGDHEQTGGIPRDYELQLSTLLRSSFGLHTHRDHEQLFAVVFPLGIEHRFQRANIIALSLTEGDAEFQRLHRSPIGRPGNAPL